MCSCNLPDGVISLTCRRRHVKCDEAKPRCGRCTKRMDPCIYSSLSNPNKTGVSWRAETGSDPSRSISASEESTRGHVSTSDASDQRELPLARNDAPASQQVVSELRYVAQDGVHEIGVEATTGCNDKQLECAPLEVNAVDQDLQISRLYSHQQEAHWQPFLSPYSSGPHLAGVSEPSTTLAVESPTTRWLDLLIADASLGNRGLPDFDVELGDSNIFGNAISPAPGSNVLEASPNSNGQSECYPRRQTARNPALQERNFPLRSDQIHEKQAWHSSEPVRLLDHEHKLFRHFVQHISQWVSKTAVTVLLPILTSFNLDS